MIGNKKGGNLLFGQFIRIFKDPSGIPHKEWLAELPNDGVIRYLHIFNNERVMPTTPQALAEVLVTKNYDFIKPDEIREGLGRVLGEGVLLAEGDEHKRQRRNLMPAFAFRHIKDLYPIFWSKAQEATEKMTTTIRGAEPNSDVKSSDTAIVEVGDWASRSTLDIIGTAGLGKDFNSIQDPSNKLYQTYRTIFNPSRVARVMQLLGFFIPRPLIMAIPIKRNHEFVQAIRTIKQTALDLIIDKKTKLQASEKSHTAREDADILSVALESGGFSDEDLQNQLMTFLAAGHETTASSMTWAAYVLSKHADIQRRLREEIRANLPSISQGGSIDSTMIDRLPYLSAVCNEIQRFYPPVTLTLRKTARDTSIVGHFIPADTTVIIPIWAVNTSKTLWGPDADQFNPGRWLKPGQANSGGADSNYSFLTFLHGPRSCIGQKFAMAEFACLLAAWAGRFEMELADPDYELDIQGGVTMKPNKDTFRVRMKVVEGW